MPSGLPGAAFGASRSLQLRASRSRSARWRRPCAAPGARRPMPGSAGNRPRDPTNRPAGRRACRRRAPTSSASAATQGIDAVIAAFIETIYRHRNNWRCDAHPRPAARSRPHRRVYGQRLLARHHEQRWLEAWAHMARTLAIADWAGAARFAEYYRRAERLAAYLVGLGLAPTMSSRSIAELEASRGRAQCRDAAGIPFCQFHSDFRAARSNSSSASPKPRH